MLEQEGFRYEGYVDIFDAGPTVECFRDNIHAVRRSRCCRCTLGEEDPVPDSLTDDVLWLVANRRFDDFRAILAHAPARVDRFPLLPAADARVATATRARVRFGEGRCSVRDAVAPLAPKRPIEPSDTAIDVNFDGIPGPTHNYAGLARGNLAAERNARQVANPREAALQGLAKMRALAARGFPQAVLPPHERPVVAALRALGFAGRDADVVARAARDAPQLLAACSSAAAMWVANAATVSPSADTADGRVHFTPANLVAHFHRSLEAPTTTRVLRAIFADPRTSSVHDPLPAAPQFGDEGAANHTRFAQRRRARRRVLRLRPRRVRRGRAGAARFPGAADARSVGGDRAAARPRSRAHASSRSRIPRRSTPASSTTT